MDQGQEGSLIAGQELAVFSFAPVVREEKLVLGPGLDLAEKFTMRVMGTPLPKFGGATARLVGCALT